MYRMNSSVWNKHYARLRREGIIKSLMWGIAFGLIAAFIVGFATWMSYFHGFFLTLGIMIAVAAGVTVGAYYLHYKPTPKNVARRVDSLGLEERLITMLELEDDDSYIASAQRADAESALSRLGMGKAKFTVSLLLILLLAIGGSFGLAMTTVTGLSDLGVVPSGAQLIDEAHDRSPHNFITVSYKAGQGGEIQGETEQVIKKGSETSMVAAIAKPGYRFYCWTDTNTRAARADRGLTESVTFTALFVPVDADGGEDDLGLDRPNDIPPEDGNDNDDPPMPSSGSSPPSYDYIVDWKMEYKPVLEDSYNDIMDEISSDGELTDEERKFLEAYYNSIK